MRNYRLLSALASSVAILALMASPAAATTTTSTFPATITLQASCQVLSSNTLAFGTQGVLASNTNTSATFTVQCTNSTTYNVGLDAGTTTGGSTTTRLMANGANTVSYKMYSDSGHTTNWGNTVGTDTVSGTGNGAQQTLTVYGVVPAQSTPAPATYSDTVTVTVTY
ncbi:MAG TPA: spore coat U domain-containing protein [Rhizomicrobium sp.]|nr:spore coat U domain-containing protein [Rhizomicrobium sp.]